jgi:hypothetical protein
MITTIVDEGQYLFNMTQYLIRSLAVHMPSEHFCLVVVNGTGKYEKEILSWHPNLIIKNYTLDVKKEHERGYQFCYMVLPLHDLLLEYPEDLIYMDGDIVVRDSLQPIFDDLKKYDFMIRYRPFLETHGPLSATHGAKVNSGVTAFANNEKTQLFTLEFKNRTIEFLEKNGDPIRRNKNHNTLTAIDQELLWLLYLEFQKKISFFPLNDKYNDSYFTREGVVWHAKGIARTYPSYKIECYKYGNKQVNIWKERSKLYYQRFKQAIKNILAEPSTPFKIEELEDILKACSCEKIIIINSDFYTHNVNILDDKKVICYDINPAIYYKNRDFLQKKNIPHFYEVYDCPNIIRENSDLLICEKKNENLFYQINSSSKLIKN